MEPGTPIRVFCPTLGLQNRPALYVATSPHGYYEVELELEKGLFRARLPIAGTVLMARDATPEVATFQVDR